MRAEAYRSLLSTESLAESFVRRALALFEADLRRLALLALADWERAGVVVPELFLPIAGLQRPSWGTWNGLRLALRDARKVVLRSATAERRRALEGAERLARILEVLDEPLDADASECLRALADFTHGAASRHPTLGEWLAAPIALRNRIVHDTPTAASWWDGAADALRPLVARLASWHPEDRLQLAEMAPSPWFDRHAEQSWSLQGVRRDGVPIYVSEAGESRLAPERSGELLRSLQRLLGKADVQEANFRQLLARLAPDEIRGVLLGDCLVGRQIGEGGYATVHLGRQLSTGRKIAVKLLKDGMPDEVRQRFQQEAQFLSRVTHPQIVGVYGHGEGPWSAPRAFSLDDEEWFQRLRRSSPVKAYIALEWIEGRTLEEVFRSPLADRPDAATLTSWFEQAAQALTVAHAAGLTHRDIKPGNLMVTAEGIVKLMDFGIARSRRDVDLVTTTSGQVLGTPAYMSPEQLRAADAEAEVGPASDIYQLCATFYELYTGRRLYDHDHESAETVRTRKLSGELPARPGVQVRGLAWELETILLGGLEPEPADRYRSADELRRDLLHVLADEPIEYRRPSLARRARLAYRRNRAVANTVGVALLTALIGAGVYLRSLDERRRLAEQLADQEQTARKSIEAEQTKTAAALVRETDERERAERLLRRQYVLNGARRLDSGDLAGSLPWYVAALALTQDPNEERAQRTRIGSLLRSMPSPARMWFEDRAPSDIEFTPDGRRVLLVWTPYGEEGAARLADPKSGEWLTPRMTHPGQSLVGATLSADGTRVLTFADATEERAGEARVWDALTGLPLTPPLRHVPHGKAGDDLAPRSGGVTCGQFSPDGRLVATGGRDHTTRLWLADTGEPAVAPLVQPDVVEDLAFSTDGARLAIGCEDGSARIWSVADGQPLHPPLTHDDAVQRLKFTPDDQTLLTVTRGGQVRRWNASSGESLGDAIEHGGWLLNLDISPDGRWFLVGSYDGSARVYKVATGEPVAPFWEHSQSILDARFRADGLAVASGGHDRQARVWFADNSEPALPPIWQGAWVRHVEFSRDGRWLAVAGSEPGLWDGAVTAGLVRTLPHAGMVRSVWFDDDGRLLTISDRASPLDDPACRLTAWDWEHGRPLGAAAPYSIVQFLDAVFVEFSDDGRRVAGSRDGELRVWRADSGEPLTPPLPLGDQVGLTHGVFSPDGRLIAVHNLRSRPGWSRLFNANDGTSLGEPRMYPRPVVGAAFSGNGQRLAVLCRDDMEESGELQLIDCATGEPSQAPLSMEMDGEGVELDDAGRLAVVRSRDGAQVWDLVSGVPTTALLRTGEAGTTTVAIFSPDHRHVLTAQGDLAEPFLVPNREGGARVWDARTGAPVTPVLAHRGGVRHACFSRDGLFVATASWDGTARVWDARTGDAITPPLQHDERVHHVAFNADASRLATACWDGTARVWDISPTPLDLEECGALADLLARYRIDAAGGETPLEQAETAGRWEHVRRIGEPPGEESRRVALWHERQAELAELVGLWQGAELHLGELLARSPDDAEFRARRGSARAAQGRWREALDDYQAADDSQLSSRRLYEMSALAATTAPQLLGHVRELLFTRFADSPEAEDRLHVVEAALLDVAAFDRTPWLRLAAELQDYPDLEHRAGMVLGRTLVRAGKFAEAIEQFADWESSVEDDDPDAYSARDALFAAQAHRQLGDTQRADKLRLWATQWIDANHARHKESADWPLWLEVLRVARQFDPTREQ